MEVKPSPSQRNSGRWSEPIPRELGRREAVPGVAGLTEGQRRPRPGPRRRAGGAFSRAAAVAVGSGLNYLPTMIETIQELHAGEVVALPRNENGRQPLATASRESAGGSRTHDGGFAIRFLSHLATAPISRNPLPHSRLRKAGTGGWEANYDARSTISVGVN